MIPSALSSSLQGIRISMQQVARSAESIARAGLESTHPAPDATATNPRPAVGPPVPALELEEALVQMRIAQRAYTAQLRVAQTADAMSEELLRPRP